MPGAPQAPDLASVIHHFLYSTGSAVGGGGFTSYDLSDFSSVCVDPCCRGTVDERLFIVFDRSSNGPVGSCKHHYFHLFMGGVGSFRQSPWIFVQRIRNLFSIPNPITRLRRCRSRH